jgi:hypothetical protein
LEKRLRRKIVLICQDPKEVKKKQKEMSFLFRNLTVQKRKGGAKGGNDGQRFNPNGNGDFNNPNDPSAPKKMLKTDTPLPNANYHQQYNPAMQGIQQNPLNFGLASIPNNPISKEIVLMKLSRSLRSGRPALTGNTRPIPKTEPTGTTQ